MSEDMSTMIIGHQMNTVIDDNPDVATNSVSEDIRVVMPSRKFKKIPVHVALGIEPDNESTCLICQHHIVNLQKYTILPVCYHSFHRKCIKKWLCKYRAQCPHCRQELDGSKPMLRSQARRATEDQSNMQLLALQTHPLYSVYPFSIFGWPQTSNHLDTFYDVMIFVTLAHSDEELFSNESIDTLQSDAHETELSRDIHHHPHTLFNQVLADLISYTDTRDTETDDNYPDDTDRQINPQNS